MIRQLATEAREIDVLYAMALNTTFGYDENDMKSAFCYGALSDIGRGICCRYQVAAF